MVINEKEAKAFADVCVMSESTAADLGLKISKTRMKTKPYGSRTVLCKGRYTGTVMFGDEVENVCIYVVKQNLETLLSGRVSEALGIIQFKAIVNHTSCTDPVKEEVLSRYKRIFSSVGTLTDYKVTFYIDKDVQPVAQPARAVPFHLRQKLEKEIERLEREGSIEEHEGPAPWISNVVLAPMDDGGTRLTIDMREANRAIKSTNIPIPKVEDIKSRIAGCKIFSKIDFNSAFHQLKIDEQSRYITVFHAGDRLMRRRKLTTGTTTASGELTRALLPLFKHIPEMHVIHDDALIATSDKVQHDKVLNQVLSIIGNSGMPLNADKCQFYKHEVPFWGFLINEGGAWPNPETVEALRQATRPETKEELISFLCMVQSNKDFVPNIAQNTQHLRELTKYPAST